MYIHVQCTCVRVYTCTCTFVCVCVYIVHAYNVHGSPFIYTCIYMYMYIVHCTYCMLSTIRYSVRVHARVPQCTYTVYMYTVYVYIHVHVRSINAMCTV